MKKHCSMIGLFSDVPDFFFVFLLSTIPLLIYWHQKQFLLLTNRYESKSCGVFRWWDWGTVFYTWPSRSNRFVAMSPVRFTCLRIHKKKVKIHNSINIKIIFHHVSFHLLLFVVTFSFSLCARSNVHATCDMHKHDAVTSMFGLGASNSSNNNNSSHIYLVHFILSSYNDSFGESSMFVICLSNALNT